VARHTPAFGGLASRLAPATAEPGGAAPAEAARIAASRIEPAAAVELPSGIVLTAQRALPPTPVPPSERLTTPAPLTDGPATIPAAASPPALVEVHPRLAAPSPGGEPAAPAGLPDVARPAPPSALATPSLALSSLAAPSPMAPAPAVADPAAPPAAPSAGTDEMTVAALETPPVEIPSGPVIAVPPATTAPKPPMCLADENSNMKRRAVLGSPVAAGNPEAFGLALAAAAHSQLGDFIIYTDKYYNISYPMGDIPALYGVCTDVVIRAYRAVGIDLQKLIHEARAGSGDTNIEHRRVDTQRRFFEKMGAALPITEFAEDYRPGDVVSYYRPQNRHSRTHIAVVSDVIGPSGRPMIIHNRGWGPQIEDALFVDEITGHYRYSGPAPAPATGTVLAGEPMIPASQGVNGGKAAIPMLKTNFGSRAQSRSRTQVR
jgi:uncharacterized protein YijF (DUF1287 family)